MAWDKDKPAATTSLRSSNPEMLENQSVLETAVDNEHDFATGGTQTGDHTQGSARCYSQASAPATRIDGAGFLSTDLGSLWVDTDDNAVYILTATTPTWTPLSTEVIATLLGVPRTFLDTLDVTGTLTALADAAVTTSLTVGTTLDIASTIPIVGVIDDDTMATATDTNIATSESVKAYAELVSIKAWVRYNGQDASFTNNLNVASVTDIDTGKHRVTWTTPFASDDYVVVVTSNKSITFITTQPAGYVEIQTADAVGAPIDASTVNVMAIGPQ